MEETELIKILNTPIEELDLKNSYRIKLIRTVGIRRSQSPYKITDPVIRVKDVFKIGLRQIKGTIGLGPLAYNAFVDYLTSLGVDVDRLSIDFKNLSGEPLKPLKVEEVLMDLQQNGANVLSDYAKPRFDAGSDDLNVIIQAFLEYLKMLETQKSQTNNANVFYNLTEQIETEIATFEKIVGVKQLPQGNLYIHPDEQGVEENMREHEKRLKKYKLKPGDGQPTGGGFGLD